MSEKFNVLFLGDLVGRSGRRAVEKFLKEECPYNDAIGQDDSVSQVSFGNSRKDKYDFIIANVENASHGFGLTKKNHDELISYGINCMTSGNHIWDKKDIYTYINDSSVLIRPLNYHKTAHGVGYRVFNDKIIVINLLGKTFMQPVICPFQALYDIMTVLKNNTGIDDKIIIVDFHAEATAEKICFAHFAYSLGVSAVLGTHTHVQTADERVIDQKIELSEEFNYFPKAAASLFMPKESMVYITDAGFCGSYESVIGMEYENSLRRLVSSIPERFDVAACDSAQINAVHMEFDIDTGCGIKIERINKKYIETGGIA